MGFGLYHITRCKYTDGETLPEAAVGGVAGPVMSGGSI
jgi:hypothetical protein